MANRTSSVLRDARALASRKEVAEYLNVPPASLTQWAHRRTGPRYVIVGRHARYRWSDVEDWLASQQAGGVPA